MKGGNTGLARSTSPATPKSARGLSATTSSSAPSRSVFRVGPSAPLAMKLTFDATSRVSSVKWSLRYRKVDPKTGVGDDIGFGEVGTCRKSRSVVWLTRVAAFIDQKSLNA